MKNRLNKIILGSANFGIKYGYKYKKINNNEILSILKLSSKYGIKLIDTAQSYGNSEKKLGKYNSKNFKFITKISNLKYINQKKIHEILETSKINLKVNKIECLMFHDYKEFVKKKFFLPNMFVKMKGKSFNKIGVSVYKPSELYKCLKFKKLDIIQIPFNIIDYRWNDVNFNKIKSQNRSLEIHVRSIFLRGILPNRIQSLPNWFKNKQKLTDELNLLKIKYDSNLEEILFNYVLQQKWVNKIVIGISTLSQLKKIKSYLKFKKKINLDQKIFSFIPTKILMPKYW
jgi:aryl-alcohol dehydrogenase-like predicted oxidoreductase